MKRVIYDYFCDHCDKTIVGSYVTISIHSEGVGRLNRELCRDCGVLIFDYVKANKEVRS